jgi:hypothetical protein
MGRTATEAAAPPEFSGAAPVLGQRSCTVTEVYAEADLQRAIDIMREIG